MRCEDAQELITAMVDQELAGTERSAIEAHLGECGSCALAYREEMALKAEIRRVTKSVMAPRELRERIAETLSRSPAPAGSRRPWGDRFGASRWALWPAFALAAAVLLAVPMFHLIQPRQSIALQALSTHERIVSGAAAVVRAASQAEVKDRLTRSVAGRFAPMGYDLSAMRLGVVGGLVEEVKGRKVLVTVYEGEAPSLTCYTFLGSERDAPANAEVFFDPQKRINFYLFSHGDVNGVLHREGNVICILVSKMQMSDLLELARAKARPT